MNLFSYFNWTDLAIIIVILYFLAEAFRVGLWAMLNDFFYMTLALVSSFFGYRYPANLYSNTFSIQRSFANVLGFLTVAVFSGAIFSFFLTWVIKKIPKKYWGNKWNYNLALIPALGEALVIIAFVLTLILGFPVSSRIKSDISNSKIGGYIVAKSSLFNSRINEVFGQAIDDSISYLTIHPGSREIVPLTVGSRRLSVDEASEKAMIDMVNEERAKAGVGDLKVSVETQPVAREYARDMWERQYFGHYSPEGEDVVDRLEKEGLSYSIVGENLAMAPDATIAHNGLMNSLGHRSNILLEGYNRVGIGVVDNGVYGKIFVQIFTD